MASKGTVLPMGAATVKPVSFQFSADGKILGCLHSKDATNMHQLYTIALPSHNVSMVEVRICCSVVTQHHDFYVSRLFVPLFL